jgi:predicted nucleotidyltransferase
MNRTDTLKLLAEHKPELMQRYGVQKLALFGSVVRTKT